MGWDKKKVSLKIGVYKRLKYLFGPNFGQVLSNQS